MTGVQTCALPILLEVCSLDSLIVNANAWKHEFDVVILANTVMQFHSKYTPTDLKTAVSSLMANGVKIIWFHTQTGVQFEKLNGTGGTATSISVVDIFDGLSVTNVSMSSPTGTISHTADYDFPEEIVKPNIQITASFLRTYSSTDSLTKFPLLASNGINTAKIEIGRASCRERL